MTTRDSETGGARTANVGVRAWLPLVVFGLAWGCGDASPTRASLFDASPGVEAGTDAETTTTGGRQNASGGVTSSGGTTPSGGTASGGTASSGGAPASGGTAAGGSAGSGGTVTVTQECTSGTPCRVMPLGDSITHGFNVPGGYRIHLWELLTNAEKSVDFVGSDQNGPESLGDKDHEGHSGWLIEDIDEQVVGWLNSYQPSIILLKIGTNDMVFAREPPGAPGRLRALVDKIAQTSPNSTLLLASIVTNPDQAVRDRIKTFNAEIPAIVAEKAEDGYSIYYVDMFSALTLDDIGDGVHPNAGGYDKMANEWWTVLSQLLP